MRYLYLIRHAKARSRIGTRDFDRELSQRGSRDCYEMARQLLTHDVPPQMVIASAARRTHQTAETIQKHTNAELQLIHRLYLASVEVVIQVIQEIDSDVQSVAIVGHNPSISYAVDYLSDDRNPPALRTMEVAYFNVVGDWSRIASETVDLQGILHP